MLQTRLRDQGRLHPNQRLGLLPRSPLDESRHTCTQATANTTHSASKSLRLISSSVSWAIASHSTTVARPRLEQFRGRIYSTLD